MQNKFAYTITEDTINAIVIELRKFFGVQAPYDTLLYPGLIPQDLVFQATTNVAPVAGSLFITDEEPMDDRNLPVIVVTGFSGPPHPLGLGQHGINPRDTREPNPLIATAVRCATVQAQVLATDFVPGQIIDGIVLALNDRVLIKDQTLGQENGVYVVQSAGAPVRSADFNTAAQFVEATAIPVLIGTQNAGFYFSQITPQPITLGTTPLDYENINGNVLEWDEFVEAFDLNITIGIRCKTTSQRARLADLLILALNDLKLVRGQLQKQDVIIQPPGLRMNPPTEEPLMGGTAFQLVYKADFSMTLWQQWNHRILRKQPNLTVVNIDGDPQWDKD